MVQSKKLLIVVLILTVSLAPRFLLTGVRTISGERPVEVLPEPVGEWEALEVLVCPRCLEELKQAVWERKTPTHPDLQLAYVEQQLENDTCPYHHVSLTRTKEVPVDFLTKKVLPPGTEFLRKWYHSERPSGHPSDISTTIITSGSDKRSIHRPERCLQSQGWQIVLRDRVAVPSSPGAREHLLVTRLVTREPRLTPEGKKTERKEVVFYWFMGHNRITGSNLKRLAYTAWDRMVRGLNYRWSCVLLRSPVTGSVRETSEAVARFVPQLLARIFAERTPRRQRGPATQPERTPQPPRPLESEASPLQ